MNLPITVNYMKQLNQAFQSGLALTTSKTWNPPGVRWLRLRPPNLRGPRSSPSQGSRSHMTQPKIYRLQQKLKILQATTKTPHSQIKKKIHYQALYKKMFAHVCSITIDCLKIRLTFGKKKKNNCKVISFYSLIFYNTNIWRWSIINDVGKGNPKPLRSDWEGKSQDFKIREDLEFKTF